MKRAVRYFTEIKPKYGDGSKQPRETIDTFFHCHNFVVLGEPGLGKTTSFEYAASREPGAEFVRIGEFLSAPVDHLKDKTLYLDGLDEHRSRANGVDVMDAIVGRLKKLDLPKVRISCRTAEWHGMKDLNALMAVSRDANVVELALEPLTERDILSLIDDPSAFVEGARNHGLEEFLDNPQTFFLLYEFYKEMNGWPGNRTELMEGACKALLKEPNEIHSETVDDWVTDRDLVRASGYLAAVCLLSNIQGISFHRSDASNVFPAIQELDADLFSMKAATGRRVFKSAGTNRVEPKHRMIAEYMAARFLAIRVREGLPLGRVIALLTGIDGGTPPDLRGVYAWLVSMLSGMADQILVHDPYGAIIYGDAYAWGPNTKLRALDALAKLAIKDPWFRLQDWSGKPLGGLSSPEIVDKFTCLLQETAEDSHLLSVILDAITNGPELPGIQNELLTFIRDPERAGHLRERAIKAIFAACPQCTDDLITFMNDIQSGEIDDKDQCLRGSLLSQLYPDVIGYDNIASYLINPSSHHIGQYHMFLRYVIFENTSTEGLKIIARSIADDGSEGEKDVGYDDSFIGTLIRKLIVFFGESATAEELLSWLAMGVDKDRTSRIGSENAKALREFMEKHHQIYGDLFRYFFDINYENDNDLWDIWWRFREYVAYVAAPYEFPLMLVDYIEQEVNTQKAQRLFELLCNLVLNEEPELVSVSLEELFEIVDRHQDFRDILTNASKCEIEEWRKKDAARKKRWHEERETRQSRNVTNIEEYKSGIEAGESTNALIHFAQIWFGLFTDIDLKATPVERLQQEAGVMTESLLKGFVNALYQKSKFQTIRDIAKTDAERRGFLHGYLILAGMDIVAEKGQEYILALPENILRVGVAYEMANHTDTKRQWPEWLLNEQPVLVAKVLDTYWRTQLAAKSESLTKFYRFNGDEPYLSLIITILPGLLRDFPKPHPRVLESMLVNAIRYCPSDELSFLVTLALKRRFQTGSGHRARWMVVGFLLNPGKYYKSLRKWLYRNKEDKWAIHSILIEGMQKKDKDRKPTSSSDLREKSIVLLGEQFDNVNFGESGWVGDRDEPSVALDIRKLIQFFEQDPSEDVAKILERLGRAPNLSQWHSTLKFASANQLRTMREARFTYPNISQVVATIANAEPANVSDLKALVLNALKEVAQDIRHGNTDGWKSFWNLDKSKHYKAGDVHINEDTARDRLLEMLRPKLSHLDIAAEPEVRYAEEKRADIAIYCKGMKLPIEIKRDDHQELWLAAQNQLQQQYCRDPAAEGNGIFLAFWFDGRGMKTPPKGINKPADAKELEKTLTFTVPETSKGLIDVHVIDVSVPADKKA